jgi:hypothetical protein
MYVLATGKFIDRSEIEALRKDEIEKLHALEREGVVLSAYRRNDDEGVLAFRGGSGRGVGKAFHG